MKGREGVEDIDGSEAGSVAGSAGPEASVPTEGLVSGSTVGFTSHSPTGAALSASWGATPSGPS